MTTNLTLYAVWTQNASHTITFMSNGATGTMNPQTIIQGVTTTLSPNAFTNTGYTFNGWSRTTNGTLAYGNSASYTMGASDDTLYAIWTQNATHTITFDKNSESAVGSISPQSIIQGVSAPLTANTFTNTGFTFSGWSTTADGVPPEYSDGAQYLMGSSDVTLYAIWASE